MPAAPALRGPLTFMTVDRVLTEADTLAASGQLDLSALEHVDSAGLALLLELQRRARRQGKSLQLHQAPAQLRDLAGFFGLSDMLQLAA